MLESVLADVLTRVLGQYLEGIDRQSVTFGAWSGLVELRGVALRPEALAVLFETLGVNLPVTVEAGFIGLLRLNVPWNAIGTTPVLITLEDITIIARPVRGDGSDDSELQLRERRIKRARLNTDDAVREASWGVSSETESKATSSWSTWLVSDELRAKVIDNIQVHLKDIIIRFEDPFSDSQRPYLTSVVCDSLKIVSANELWNEAFVERGDDHHTRKLIEVNGFRVDWAPITTRDQPGASLSTDVHSSASPKPFQTPELLRQFVRGDASAPSSASVSAQADSLISPIDGFMRILLSPNNVPTINSVDLHQLDPAVDLDIRFPNVTCNLNDVQYTSLLQTSVYFARLATRGVRPKTAKARWVWAIDQLLPGFSDRRKRALRLTEAGMAQTRTKRMVYAAYRKSLLKARRTGVEEPNEIAEELENIEASTSYEEIIAFRDWVDRLIDTDHDEWQAIAKKQEEPESTQEGGTTTSTFWRMLGYTDEQEDEKKQQSRSTDSSMSVTEDVDQKLINIPQHEKDSISKNGSPHSEQRASLTLRVAFLLQSVTLNLSQGGFPRESIARLSCTLQNLRVGVLVSSANDLITESVLGSVEVWDVQKNAPLVCNRVGTPESAEDNHADSFQSAYPMDVSDALESIRDGTNPASDVLMHEEVYADQESDTSPAENEFDSQLSPSLTTATTQSSSSGSRRKRTRTYGAAARDATPPTFRVTEEEFIGTSRTSSSLCRYAAAFRYKRQGKQEGMEDPSAPKTYLDVSIATLEAVVDGPKGSFIWGLKFWRPRGMAQDPIMAFLGAAAGARIAELRMEIEEALVANKVPLQINAVILAPRFIIPGGRPSSPAIVVNMGTIGVCTSDNAPTFSTSEGQDFARRVRYSSYVMTLDNLGVYYCPSLVTALSRSPRTGIDDRRSSKVHTGSEVCTADTSGVERIIRPFSLRFMVQTLRDATMVQVARHSSHDWTTSEDNIAKVRVRGTVPDVSLILTQAAFQHLLITLDKWSRELLSSVHEKSGTEHEATVGNWPVSHGSTGHSLASPGAVSSNRHVRESQKHEASGKEPLPTALASYDVRLLLNRVSVELRDRAEMRLLTLTAYQIQGEVVKTKRTNVKACFSLQSWAVTDGSRGSTAAYRRLVYAGNLSGSRGVSPPRSMSGTADSRGQEMEEDRDFITVRYDLDFRTGHQRVQLHFLSLNVVCVRETYIRLARYFRGVREHVKANRVKRRNLHHIDPGSPHGEEDNFRRRGSRNHGQQGHQDESPALRHTFVISEFDGLNFQLIASGGVVAVFEMRESKIQYLKEGNTAKAWGDFRYFSVRDLTSPVRDHISVISYEKPVPAIQRMLEPDCVPEERRANSHDEWYLSIPRSRGAKYELNGNFRGIKITLLYRFCDVLMQYFKILWKEFEPIVELVTDTENGAHDQARLTREFKGSTTSSYIVNLVLNDLTLRLPRHSACASEALNIGIQDICVSNAVEVGDNNKWSCRLTDAQFAVEYLLLHSDPSCPISVSSSFLTNFMADIVVGVAQNPCAEAQGAPIQTRREVWLKANRDVFLSLSEAQYTVLYSVLTENLAETVTELDLSLSMDGLMEELVREVVHTEAGSCKTEDARKSNSPSGVENVDVVPQLQNPKDVGLETFVAVASLPSFVLEISRGWDVTRESCKVLGIRLKNLRTLIKRFDPRRLVVELDAKLLALEDLRPESRRLSSEFAVPIVSRERFEPAFDLGKIDMQQNLSMVYDKEGLDRPAIFVALSSLQFDIPLDLIRDVTNLAVPGWPFLESSAFPPDFVYLGRTLNVVMNDSQLLLRTYQHERDRRALAVVGEFEIKMEWMRHTGAKLISLETRQMEVSCVHEIRPLGEEYDLFGVKSLFAYPIEASTTPLLYPSNFFVEYIGPLADDKGCRLHLSSEALLCLVNASDLPLLRAVGAEIRRKQQSYLSRRAWKQPSYPPGKASTPLEPKEQQRRMALASMNVSMDIAAVRCLLSDNASGQFVPVLETQISSLMFSSHAGNITQIEGVASMDLFNSEKGWWEPALEPWHLAASISHGQSGAKSYIIRSDKRADFNITPTTITAVLTVLKTLSSPGRTASSSSEPQTRKLFVRESDSNDRPAVAAFFVRNELGLPVNVNLPSTSRRITIIHGSEIEVQAQSESLVSAGTERTRISRESALRCSLTIPSYYSKNVSASEVGIFPLAFFPTESGSADGERKKLYVVWEVKMSKGVPLCTLRSQYRILNGTKRSMEIFVSKANKGRLAATNAGENTIFLDPGEAFPVPLQYTKNEISVRPVKRTRREINSLFEWSSPMPSMKWLRRVARDSERNLERTKNAGGKQTSYVRSQFLVCKALEKGNCDFFMKLEPTCSVSYESSRSSKQGWIDVALLAPIVLKNDLPGSLFYKVTQSETDQNAYPGSSYDYEETILAAGKICSLETEHLHFSGESMTPCFLSLAYDNLPRSRKPDTSWIPEFGKSVNLLDVENGRVKAVLTAPETRSAVAKEVRDLRCAISSEESVSGKFTISAGVWVRNRSDTALEVSSRSSFYGTGSNSIILRSRPPFKEPDEYVCLEGPYLSLRILANSSEVRAQEEFDQGKWWTTPSSLLEAKKPITVNLPGRSLILELGTAVGVRENTRLVTIRNESWILNCTTTPLQWCQTSALDAHGNCPTRYARILKPGGANAVHWETKSSSFKAVHLRITEEHGQSDWIWSPAIPLNIGFSRELPAKMYRPKTHEQYIARIDSKKIGRGSRALVIFPEDRQNPPYRIVNLCKERAVAFSQLGSHERPWLVRGGKSTRYSWDDPLAPPDMRKLSVRILEREDLHNARSGSTPVHDLAVLSIDVVGERVMVLYEGYEPNVNVNVAVEGATKIVTFSDAGDESNPNSKVSPDRRQSRRISSVGSAEPVPVVAWDEMGHTPEDSPSPARQHVNDASIAALCDYPLKDKKPEEKVYYTSDGRVNASVFLNSIGVSLIDVEPAELVYIRAKGILMNIESSHVTQTATVHIQGFQVDNQLHQTLYPVLLSVTNPQADPERSFADETYAESGAIALTVKRALSSDDIIMIKSFQAAVNPFHLSLEDKLITRLIRFLADTSIVGNRFPLGANDKLDEDLRIFRSILPQSSSDNEAPASNRQTGGLSSSKRIYVHDFKINSSVLRLTSVGSGAAVAKAAGVGLTASTILGLVLNVENCEFQLAALEVQNVFDSVHHFSLLVKEYYLSQLSNQRMKLLASNALMGNPAALFDAVGTGAKDFLNESGKAKGSAEFIASVGRGSKSLVSHTVGGIMESVSSIPRAVSSGLEKAVGDNAYLAERQRIRTGSGQRNQAVRNPAQGFATGALSFAHGISSGVTGFIREPVQGARQGGAGGLLKGIGKAFIGGVAKPVAGAIDLVAEPAAGLSRQIADDRAWKAAIPERPPRAFRGQSRRLDVYDRRFAVGVCLFKAVQSYNNLPVDSDLIDWVELSEREGRSDSDADLWAWSIIRQFSRSMPGWKKQLEGSQRRSRAGSSLETRVEKTRAALITESDVIVATLDCKLVAWIALWADAKYDVWSDGKDVVLSGQMVENGGEDMRSGIGAGSIVNAPWDVPNVERKRRPSVGERFEERIACGSSSASDDVRQRLAKVLQQLQEEREGKQEMWSGIDSASRSQELLALGGSLDDDNEIELRSGKRTSAGASQLGRLGRPVGGGWRSREEKKQKRRSSASLERTVRRLVGTGTRRGVGTGGLRFVVANRLEGNMILVVREGRLDGTTWSGELAKEIERFDAQVVETERAGEGVEVAGCVVYDILSAQRERIGEVVVELFCGKDGAASFTTKASHGFHADFEKEGRHGAFVFYIRESVVDVVSSRIYGGDGDGGVESAANVAAEAVSDERMVQQLVDIGFRFEDAVMALAEAEGDMVKAVDLLTK